MSIFNNTTARPLRTCKHWSYRAPDKRNPAMHSFLSVKPIATVKPPSKGIYHFNGETLPNFDAVKDAARKQNFGILRMGAVNINL